MFKTSHFEQTHGMPSSFHQRVSSVFWPRFSRYASIPGTLQLICCFFFVCFIFDLTYLRAFLEAIPVDSKFRVDEPIFFRSTARQRGIEHGNSKEYTTSKDPDSAVIAAIQTKMGFSTDQ